MLQRRNGNDRGVLHVQGGLPTSPEDSMSRPLAVFLAATLLASGAAPLAAGAPAWLRWQQAEARVIGRVVDARTNAPLSSVRVSVVGTAIGVLTNADGRYELLGVAAGTHDVQAQRIGYRRSTQTVDVPSSGVATVDFGLGEEALALEQVEVIRGAAAATLYGTEAAAGVIEIFTKHGTAGKTAFTFQTNQGISWMRPYGSDVRPLLNMEPWLKQAYGHSEALSVSGGSGQAQYYLSAGFDDKDGVAPQARQRPYSMRGNLTLQPLTNLTLHWNSLVSKNDLAMSPDGNSGESIFFNVYRSPVTSLGAATPENIAKLLTRTTTQTDDRLIVGASATWVPLGWMSHTFTFGYDRAAMSGEVFHPYGFVFQPTGDVSELDWRSETVTLDYAASAQAQPTNDFKATFSVGGQLVHTADARVDGYGRGLPGPGKQTLSRAAERFVFSGGQEVKTGGFFLQSLLAWKDRYFLTGGLRVDGSSAFGSSFGLQAYPKLSASYVISDEPFWPATLGTAKLRAAYGFAGRAPGVFDAVRPWT